MTTTRAFLFSLIFSCSCSLSPYRGDAAGSHNCDRSDHDDTPATRCRWSCPDADRDRRHHYHCPGSVLLCRFFGGSTSAGSRWRL